MKSNYKRLGDYILLVDIRNTQLKNLPLVGVTINKKFIPSVANIIGTDLTKYKIIKKNQFACSLMQVRRDGKIPVALMQDCEAIISSAYPVFEIINIDELLPEYLMMWFSRKEFDRESCFYAVGGVRGSLEWEDFCDMKLPMPSLEKQKEIVKEYETITNRIKLNELLNQKLEDTAQTIYKEWFVNFEFPNEQGLPYKSNGGEMVYSDKLDMEMPKGWEVNKIIKFANLKYGKMLDSDKFLERGYPIFSGYGIRGYYSSYMYEESQILVLSRGVSGTGEVRLSPPKAYITNLSIVVEIIDKTMSKYFVYYYLKNQNLRQLDSGSAQSQITINDLIKFPVLCPDKNIQKKFNNLVKNLKLNLDLKNQNNECLNKFKEVLLSKIANNKK